MRPTLTHRALVLLCVFPLLMIPERPVEAALGSPIQQTGRFGLGVVARRFTRDVFDVRRDKQSNPNDEFGYVAMEARMGVWRDRLDFAIELGRASNAEGRFPDRDYLTYEAGVTLRGLVYRRADGQLDLTGGVHVREAVGFDREATQTHKLRRHLAIFGLVGRPIKLGGRQGRVYFGPLYSAHSIDDYGAAGHADGSPGEGETRNNLQVLVGATVALLEALELGGDLTYRNSVSFGGSALFAF